MIAPPNYFDLIVVGAGPAGVFASIWAKTKNPKLSILIIEKSAKILTKVRISGGGRCNLTNTSLNSQTMNEYYPRGAKELIGAMTRWSSADTMNWFISRGVDLKTEEEGRVFPATNQSETIVDCLQGELDRLGIEVCLNQEITFIAKQSHQFCINNNLHCQKLILATGSNKEGYRWAKDFGHSIVPPVPSLFSFNVQPFSLKELSGIAIDPVEVKIDNRAPIQTGAIMITHFGFSGPAILKLSAFHARYLSDRNYQADLSINWLPSQSEELLFNVLSQLKSKVPHQRLVSINPFSFPKSLWKTFLGDRFDRLMQELSFKELKKLSSHLHSDRYSIVGKSSHKEEFVACGGIHRKEINFKTMESKICPYLFFAGEILDIDGITGGFNLQNCWTTGYLAGSNCVSH